jgi:hypothetical protein
MATVAASATLGTACESRQLADVIDAVSNDTADAITPTDATDIVPPTDAIDASECPDACEVPPGAPGYVCMPDPFGDANPTCPANRTCEAAPCPSGCISCFTSSFDPGFSCVPDPHADVVANCPMHRLCAATDCPAGCQACSAPYFCYPQPDSGVTNCMPTYVCNPSDCQPECTPLG